MRGGQITSDLTRGHVRGCRDHAACVRSGYTTSRHRLPSSQSEFYQIIRDFSNKSLKDLGSVVPDKFSSSSSSSISSSSSSSITPHTKQLGTGYVSLVKSASFLFQNMSGPAVAQPGQSEHFWTPLLEHVVAPSPKLARTSLLFRIWCEQVVLGQRIQCCTISIAPPPPHEYHLRTTHHKTDKQCHLKKGVSPRQASRKESQQMWGFQSSHHHLTAADALSLCLGDLNDLIVEEDRREKAQDRTWWSDDVARDLNDLIVEEDRREKAQYRTWWILPSIKDISVFTLMCKAEVELSPDLSPRRQIRPDKVDVFIHVTTGVGMFLRQTERRGDTGTVRQRDIHRNDETQGQTLFKAVSCQLCAVSQHQRSHGATVAEGADHFGLVPLATGVYRN
uniref:Uncharacterized protein n=1 Tax=Timema bartmani TaxID=61472 RepID=A0A7R9F6P8_9NEOP|nr:unnamed protein product [Timema bartmani]